MHSYGNQDKVEEYLDKYAKDAPEWYTVRMGTCTNCDKCLYMDMSPGGPFEWLVTECTQDGCVNIDRGEKNEQREI